MAITVRCVCGKSIHFKDDYAGQRVKCHVCQAVFIVPDRAQSPVELDGLLESSPDEFDEPVATESAPEVSEADWPPVSEQDGEDLSEKDELVDVARLLRERSADSPERDLSQIGIPIGLAAVSAVPAWWVADSSGALAGFLIFMFVGALMLGLYSVAKSHRDQGRRFDELRKISDKLGLGLERFQLISSGRMPLLTDLQSGQHRDVKFACFTYQMLVPAGKASYTTVQTVIVLQPSGIRLPDFSIRPGGSGWMNKDLTEFITGPTDINFESHPAFSDGFQLRGSDQAAVRTLFNTRVLEFFEQQPALIVECCSNRLLIYRQGATIELDHRQQFINESLQLLALFRRQPRTPGKPSAVVEQNSEGPGTSPPRKPARTQVTWSPHFVDPPNSPRLRTRLFLFFLGLVFLPQGILPLYLGIHTVRMEWRRFRFPRDLVEFLFWFGPLVMFFGIILLGIALFGLWLLRAALARTPDIRTDPGAPEFPADALLCQFGHTAVIVDHTAGLIHCRRCYSGRGKKWGRTQAWFTCPLTDVLRAYYMQQGNLSQFVIETRTGSVTINKHLSNYGALCEYFSDDQ